MKKTVFVVLISSMIAAFTPVGTDPAIPANVRELSGYKLRGSDFSLRDFNLWFVTNQGVFDKTFIAEDETALKPEFDNEWVVAAKVETYANTYKVKFRRVIVQKDELNVYFQVQKEGESKRGEGQVTLASVEKNNKLKKVNFYHDNVLVRSVAIVNVY